MWSLDWETPEVLHRVKLKVHMYFLYGNTATTVALANISVS